MMIPTSVRLAFVALALALGMAACASPQIVPSQQQAGPGEQQAGDLAWQALEPNTASHARANWEIVEVKQVAGRDVAAQFDGDPAPGCWKGPTAVPNGKVDPAGAYWYVHLKPRPATSPPPQRTRSPTEPPDVPEPFMFEALFLIDAADGHVVARKLACVIY